MTHQLFFYSKGESAPRSGGLAGFFKKPVNKDDLDKRLLDYLKGYEHFNVPDITPDGFDMGYFNKSTGANVFLNLHRNNPEGMQFPGYRYTGLTYTINSFRPLYFGYETMPILEAICRKFDLYVVDPQDFEIGGSGKPKPCSSNELIDCWRASNKKATARLAGDSRARQGTVQYLVGPDLDLFLTEDKAIGWWRYTSKKEALAQRLYEADVPLFVPNLMILKRKADHKLFVTMAFTEGVGYVLPPCDLFFVVKHGDVMGIAYPETLLPIIGEYLKPFECDTPNLRMLSGEDADNVSGAVNGITFDADPQDFEPAPPGKFLDFDPLQAP